MNYAQLYFDELCNEVIPFWETYSIDHEDGGYYSCIDHQNKVYDTDKFMWLQCRQIWMFATLYAEVDKNPSWLEIAEKGIDFVLKNGHDGDYNWYFSLNKKGDPLIHPYNIFSFTFACLCLSKMFAITADKKYSQTCLKTLDKIHEKAINPKGKWNKSIGTTRSLRNFALPMILCNLYSEMGTLLDDDLKAKKAADCVAAVLDEFWHPELGVILENIHPDGSFSNTFEGRLFNPGHCLEALWFVMELGEKYNRSDWIQRSVDYSLKIIEKGWDHQHEGIFYFLDVHGHPPQQLEWDQKLWWVHLEAMICFLKGYQLTKNQACLDWFENIHAYTWSHFRDHKNKGEWYGYLNRSGKVLLPLKGGKWKGCFHVPRALLKLHQISAALGI